MTARRARAGQASRSRIPRPGRPGCRGYCGQHAGRLPGCRPPGRRGRPGARRYGHRGWCRPCEHGTGIINASETDTTTSYPNNYIRYGITKAMSETLVVKDTEVGELPKAGSTGIYPYIGVAAALMSGAMVMTVVTTKRRKAYA